MGLPPGALDDAEAFVHVARGGDPTRHYLLGVPGGAGFDAVVATDDDPVFCPAPTTDASDYDGPVRAPDSLAGQSAGERAASLLGERGVSGPLAAPPHLPHDAALRLEAAGFDLRSTAAVAEARASKSDAERAHLAAAGRAAVAGVERARTVLARARVGDSLRWRGAALDAETLRREAAAAVVDAGGSPDVAVGDPTGPETPVVLRVGARVAGYRTRCVRTAVPDPSGGWERRAHVAAERALAAGRRELAPGATAGDVRAAVAAELAAYGFADVDAACHGVGLAAREAPTGGDELREGATVCLRAAVTGDGGRVALGDTLAVAGDDLTATATDLAPR